MTDALGNLLGGMPIAHPLCRECDAPAYFRFNGSPVCVEHFNSAIASGSASSGGGVTAGAELSPNPKVPAVTDPFKNATTFRVAAASDIHAHSSSSLSGE